jgi:hypothetical protein
MAGIVIQVILSIGAVCLLFLAWFIFMNKGSSDTYTILAIVSAAYIVSMSVFIGVFRKKELYKMIWKKEGFETEVSSDNSASVFTKESCEQLKEVLNNYQQVKREHTTMKILNLDETIEQLENYLSDYACSQYDS